jgi:hypothetical protein
MNNIEFVNMAIMFAKLVHSNEGAWDNFMDDFEFSSEEKEQFEDKISMIDKDCLMIPEDFLEDLGLDDLERDTKDMTDKIVDLKLAKDDLTLDTIKDLETAAENTIDEWNDYLGNKLKNIFKKEE